MPENFVKELEGTNILIAGRRTLDLSDPQNLGLLRQKGVVHVYPIFLGEVLEAGYSKERNIKAEQLLNFAGIKFIPLPKEPQDRGPLMQFDRSMLSLRHGERALLWCYHGLHNSAAYATYHLVARGMPYEEVVTKLKKAGWTDGSIGTAKAILVGAGVNPAKFSKEVQELILRRNKLAGAPRKPQVEHEKNLNKLKEFLRRRLP